MPPFYRVRAVNTAADSENRIHDDRVAAAYGFRGGLVPGVTVYGYMTLPVLERFGVEWLERGAMNVRFKEPVYEGEEVAVEARELDGGRMDISLVGGRAQATAWRERERIAPRVEDYPQRPLPAREERLAASRESLAQGTALGTLETVLDLAMARMSAPLPAAIGDERFAHPAVLLGLANDVLMRNFVLGPWLHVSSEVANFSAARDGEALHVYGRVAEQYERKGHEFVALDILIAAPGNSGERVVQQVRHTAIWRPQGA